jgi:hypothetical protein
MASLLIAKPLSVQITCRGFFVPPKFDFYRVEISTALATKVAETFALKSTEIIVNQNAAASQYISFRYTLAGEPFRYVNVSMGIDQAEISFFNPATVPELMAEVEKTWKVIFDILKPMVKSSYFEAALHCRTEKIAVSEFLNETVRVTEDSPDLRKGFSVGTRPADAINKLTLEVSDSVENGLYVGFASINGTSVRDLAGFFAVLKSTLVTYRTLQKLASVQILEPT